jgi:hypothetical protein
VSPSALKPRAKRGLGERHSFSATLVTQALLINSIATIEMGFDKAEQ